MSAALAGRALGRKWIVESAGIGASEGEPASPQAVAVMLRRGVDLKGHKARRLTRLMLEETDVVVTMTLTQRDTVVQLSPEARDKVFLFSQLTDIGIESDIGDPWGGDEACYEECATVIEEFVEKMKAKFRTYE